MGLIAKQRKQFISHKKRWDKESITEEATLVKDYALKNKKEVRRAELLLSKFKKLAKELNTTDESKASQEAQHLIAKLKSMGYLSPDAQTLDEILDMKVRNILERRLSNLVYKQGLAKTAKQARQFVVHGHIIVAEQTISSPSSAISLAQEALIVFSPRSQLVDENHPERRSEELREVAAQAELQADGEDDFEKEVSDFDKKEAELDDEEVKEDKE
jgi:small subunit ribosomal protein S4